LITSAAQTENIGGFEPALILTQFGFTTTDVIGLSLRCYQFVTITQISPAAWRHILLNGHYTFQNNGKMIDLDVLVAGLDLG
jgi:hypothetical protein